jgi:hypothetical protein
MRQAAWQLLVQNQINYPQYSTENELNNKRIAYNWFKNNSTALNLGSPDDVVYNSFYNTQNGSATAQFEDVLDAIHSENINNAITINTNITPNCTIETLRQQVNTIYLNTWAQGIRQFTAADSAFLISVAAGNPIEWGDAVYSAQVMVGTFLQPVGNRYMPQIYYEQEQDSVIMSSSIFPNPNDGNFTVEYNIAEKATLQITDILGNCVCTYQLVPENNYITINCNELSNGIYLYKVLMNGNIVKSDKIIVIK